MIGWSLILLIALIHLGILIMEMVLWQRPLVRRVFRTTPEFAEATRVLAANQGLYNGFLAAGLCLALWQGIPGKGQDMAIFFLACIAVAGIFGAITVSRRILYVQTVPVLVAAGAVLAGI